MRNVFDVLILLVFSVSSAVFAAPSVTRLTDSRIRIQSYQPGKVVSLQASTFINTQIVFGEGEKVVDIQSGDTAAWMATVNQALPNVLNLKPTIAGSETDLSVITVDEKQKRRYYHFEIKSRTKASAVKSLYAIQFVYPEQGKAKLQQKQLNNRLEENSILSAMKNPEFYHWHYSYHGSESLRPRRVFDDGQFTYIQLNSRQVVPAVFAVNNKKGDEAIVNYRRERDYLIVHQVATQFTLRAGVYQVGSVFNDDQIALLRQRKR